MCKAGQYKDTPENNNNEDDKQSNTNLEADMNRIYMYKTRVSPEPVAFHVYVY
jgi:hypothetical protein